MKKNLKDKKSLNIAMLGHKRIPSREGGIEIVVEELASILWYSTSLIDYYFRVRLISVL